MIYVINYSALIFLIRVILEIRAEILQIYSFGKFKTQFPTEIIRPLVNETRIAYRCALLLNIFPLLFSHLV